MMQALFHPLSEEALRIASNVAQVYSAWRDAVRERAQMPASMFWTTRDSREYLAVKASPGAAATTEGPRTAQSEQRLAKYKEDRDALDAAIAARAARLDEFARQWRALRLPTVTAMPGRLLRELDLQGLLGTDVMLVGTNAFVAYELHSRHKFLRGVAETNDFDLGWCRGAPLELAAAAAAAASPPRTDLLSALRRVDKTFRVQRTKRYQAVNDDGYEVELLAAPSMHATLPSGFPFDPMYSLVEQEWLLQGRPLAGVAIAQDGKPAPLFVPDPRFMALHKMWLANKPTRSALKRDKDALQGPLLLDAVCQFMPDYALDIDFVMALPEDLQAEFDRWASSRRFDPTRITSSA